MHKSNKLINLLGQKYIGNQFIGSKVSKFKSDIKTLQTYA